MHSQISPHTSLPRSSVHIQIVYFSLISRLIGSICLLLLEYTICLNSILHLEIAQIVHLPHKLYSDLLVLPQIVFLYRVGFFFFCRFNLCRDTESNPTFSYLFVGGNWLPIFYIQQQHVSVMVLELLLYNAKGDGGIFLLDGISKNRSYKTNGVLESDPQKHPYWFHQIRFYSPVLPLLYLPSHYST